MIMVQKDTVLNVNKVIWIFLCWFVIMMHLIHVLYQNNRLLRWLVLMRFIYYLRLVNLIIQSKCWSWIRKWILKEYLIPMKKMSWCLLLMIVLLSMMSRKVKLKDNKHYNQILKLLILFMGMRKLQYCVRILLLFLIINYKLSLQSNRTL